MRAIRTRPRAVREGACGSSRLRDHGIDWGPARTVPHLSEAADALATHHGVRTSGSRLRQHGPSVWGCDGPNGVSVGAVIGSPVATQITNRASARKTPSDAGKRVAGRKRHLVVDTFGLLMAVMVTPAGQPDRDAARELLARLRMLHPQLTLIWGDSAYAGTLVEWARRFLRLTLKIVTKRPGQTGFKVFARRWIVERSLAWLMNARRNVVDFERKPAHSEAHLTVAAITLMTRRLTRKRPPAWTRKPTSAPQGRLIKAPTAQGCVKASPGNPDTAYA
ncbi:transposase [Nonomuraea sp. NPDC050153]|uniref:transposase n=1 Tax=Nonomuraea sp. NPDC050153 TaxID=3364359 RepID=UPI00378D1DF2